MGDVTGHEAAAEVLGAATLGRLRVDNVGSMLRPPALKAAFAQAGAGRLDGNGLRRIIDEEVAALVRHQEAIGFPVVVDGEFRREHYLASFAEVAGFDHWAGQWSKMLNDSLHREEDGDAPVRATDPSLVIRAAATERLRLRRNAPLDEYRSTQALTDRPVKVTVLGPDRVVQSFAIEESRTVYDGLEPFLEDVVAIEREMVGQIVDAGCRYVHIDEPGFTAYVDEHALAEMRARGDDPLTLMRLSIDANNRVIEGFPGVTFGVHLCRGNRESQWHREGTYDAIAEELFSSLRYDRLLLEYDTERAGGFEPLRFVRDDAVVVLGLVTTKQGALEGRDDLKRRIDAATAFVPIERLALSPQCGFASNMPGNRLTETEQWRKLELVLDVAADVWGDPR